MANYIALDQYSVFVPPSSQLFTEQQTVSSSEPPVQQSPETASPIVVGSASPNYGNYGSNPIRPDDFHKFGESKEEPAEKGNAEEDSLVSIYSVTPAKSQMYAMRRK